MKPRMSSSGCESRPARREPARACSQPCSRRGFAGLETEQALTRLERMDECRRASPGPGRIGNCRRAVFVELTSKRDQLAPLSRSWCSFFPAYDVATSFSRSAAIGAGGYLPVSEATPSSRSIRSPLLGNGHHDKATQPEVWVAQLRRQLLALVRRSCPVWLANQAEDIVQAALIRLLDAHRKSGGNLPQNPSYLSRVAYNAMVDEVRRHFKRKEVPEDEPLRLDHTAAATVQPEQRAAATEIHEGIRDCLAAMIPSRRMSVACHLLGYSVPEAARFLGWTPKKVEHLIHRGLADLRTCLTGKGLNP